MLIPVSDKGLASGFLTWEAKHEKDIHLLLRGLDAVHIVYQGVDLGLKKINRKTRRIHLGDSHQASPNLRHHRLTRRKDTLIIDLE